MNLNKVWSVAQNDIRVNFTDRSIWINLLLIPAVLILAVAFANGAFQGGGTGEIPRTRLDLVDQDQTAASAQFVTTLRALDASLVLCPADNDADDFCALGDSGLDADLIDTRLDTGISAAYIEIPAGFEQALLNDEPVQVIYRSTELPVETSALHETVQAAAQRVSAAVIARRLGAAVAAGNFDGDPAFTQGVYDQAVAIWNTDPVRVSLSYAPTAAEPTVESVRQNPGFRQSVPGMGSMYVMFTILAGVVILIQERNQWTLQRLLTMPVTGGEIVAGKMFARFVMGMIQYGVAFGIGLIFAQVLGFNLGTHPLAFVGILLMAAAFSVCITGLTLLLATLVRTEDQASSVTTLIALALAPIGGAWWSLDLEFIPEFMRQISYISPFRWVMLGFSEVIIDGSGVIEVLPYAAVLLVAGAVLGALAAGRFRLTV